MLPLRYLPFIVDPDIHSYNLRAKKNSVKVIHVDYLVFMFCVSKVDGVENEESLWKHSPKAVATC